MNFKEMQEKRILEQMKKVREFALSKGGECLSEDGDYVNGKSKLLWKCSDPTHESWLDPFDSVFYHNLWCPERRPRKSRNYISPKRFKFCQEQLIVAQELAKKKGGECLLTEYKKDKAPLIWWCGNKNHKPCMSPFLPA